ncbi:(d)CMP kinase [Candidatus Blochmannia ocreatus (nom. nud.)]|uniref:Cytidylate kinase n=1 Tax=Candidatus Blochmannia ocreatus (nom. nud.) TaxID=251538 RepID=A0ABY4SX94_9ENTR|nr:(d)CMP kinase [Candidatus Blochmannia ocreatus]URJ24888.1 (d)CMP kinase [Candidatus Blochmannia ocreatus]
MSDVFPVITIDGPSGSGKGTLSRKLAKILGWNLLDSGIIYRVLALIMLIYKVDINYEEKILELIKVIKINFVKSYDSFIILFNGIRVTQDIYTETIGNYASKIAALSTVRKNLLIYQRAFCKWPGLVADGRDMGTVVFPNALLKIFLYASCEEREKRRLYQLKEKKNSVNYKEFLSHIRERDDRDFNRRLAPLVPAIDALVLDSTYLSEEEVNSIVLMHIKESIMVLPPRVLYNCIHNQGR